ncbi:unnamed protein product [Polarella glacialis]|uniref:Clathrin/coatomer adaptor adaptin-like N-terminal domain-containing protein n=1 Tax=Polarella glacialis TaxID=89957 RepID=A0A813K8Q6_POLGL|nr:unnamed protein product [Polarella glacialis]
MCAMHAKSPRLLALFCAAAAVALIFGLPAGHVVQPTYAVSRWLQRQSILLHPTVAPQVPQHMNREPHQSKLPALLPSVVPGIRLFNCTMRIQGLCVLPCVEFPPIAVGHAWPTVTELQANPADFKGRGTAFMIVALALVMLACAAVEIVAWTSRCRAKGIGGGNGPSEYQRLLPIAEGNNDQPTTSTRHEAMGVTVKTHSRIDDTVLDATRQRNFASYFTFYHCGMWCGCYWAHLNGILGATGLSYEIYLAWMSAMAVIHMICLVKSICDDLVVPEQWGECSKKLVMSLTPILSEPLDGLRDPVMAALYVTSGYAGRLPALLVMIGVMLPFFHILQDQAPFDSIQEAYWPLYGKVKAQLRTNTQQAGEAVVFAVFGGSSVLSAAIGSVAFLKLLAIRFARKYILSFTAKWNMPWRGISSDDLQKACACEVVSWDIRARAVLELLTNGNPPTNVERKGVETLHELYNRYAADDEAKAAKVAMDATRPLVGMLHGRNFVPKIQDFGRQGSPATPFATDVAALLKDKDKNVRQAAVTALADLGSKAAAPFAADIIALLKDWDENVRHAAVEVLASLGPDGDGNVPLVFLRALASLGPEEKLSIATNIVALLKDKDEYVRHAAVKALDSLEPEAKLSIAIAKELAALLKDADREVRLAAVKVLEDLEPEAKLSITNELAALLKDGDGNVRLVALRAVARLERDLALDRFAALGREAAAPAPFATELAALLKDGDREVRSAAVEALAALGPEEKLSIATDIVALLKDGDREVRYAAVKALDSLEPEAKLSIAIAKELAALLKDGDREVRLAAVKVLQDLEPEAKLSITNELAALLKDGDGTVRLVALRAVARLERDLALDRFAALGREAAAPFAADVAALLKDEDTQVRRTAVRVIGSLGSAPFASDVAALLKDADKYVRCAAVRALASLGPEEKLSIATDIVALLKDKDENVRHAAVEALASLGPELGGPFAPDVAALLKDEDTKIRLAAVQALAAFGREAAAPFAAELAALLKDGDREVRSAAVEALAVLDLRR